MTREIGPIGRELQRDLYGSFYLSQGSGELQKIILRCLAEDHMSMRGDAHRLAVRK